MRGLVEYFNRVRGMNRNAHLFLVHTVLAGLSIALMSLLYNLYILSLDFKQDTIGLVTLVACVVAVVAALPVSLFLNWLGYKRALILAVLMTGISIVIPIVLPTAAGLILCEVIWGVSYTLLVIAGAPFMTENSSDAQRAQLFSLQFVLTMLTAFIGYLVGGMLPRWFAGLWNAGAESAAAYQGALYVSAALMFLAGVPFFFIQNKPAEKNAHAAPPRWMVRQKLPAVKLLTPYIIGALGAGMFVPFANVLWKTTQQASDAMIGNIFALSALIMVGAGMFAPALSRRFGPVRVVVVLQGAAVVGMLAFGFAPFLGIALAGYLARDVLMNLARPVFGQFMMDQSDPAERAAVSALGTMGFNLAWGISSWVSGVWQSENQFAPVFVASAGFGLLATFLFHRFHGNSEKIRAAQTVTRPLGSPAE